MNPFNIFRPRPKVKHDTEFQDFILRALRYLTVTDIAVLCKTSLPTVERWAGGKTAPHPLIREAVMRTVRTKLQGRM